MMNTTMSLKLAIIIICLLLMGCSKANYSNVGTSPVTMYSTEGITMASFSPINKYKGTVNGTFPDGEKFTGEYNSTINQELNMAFMSTPWGPITGISTRQTGPFISYITARGENGTMLRGITQGQHYHGFGACRDSKGREYSVHY